jgi:hypothetical protein
MKLLLFLMALLSLLLAGCSSAAEKEQVTFKESDTFLSHASRKLPLDGMTEQQIRKQFGDPAGILTKNFQPLSYGRPLIPAEADTQWIYLKSMEHTFIYFRGDRVILAVKEWSDF